MSQRRLLLGRLITGKIFFTICAFSTVILATLFQSGMFTLWSNRVRYRDIDTLKDMKESELLIQSADLQVDKNFFFPDAEFGWVRNRLIDSYRYQIGVLNNVYWYTNRISFGKDSEGRTVFVDNASRFNYSKAAFRDGLRNMDMILETDAFLMTVLSRFKRYKNLNLLHDLTLEKFEYHSVQESLMTYPVSYTTLRHSFYRKEFNDILTRFHEGGITNKLLDEYFFNSAFKPPPLKDLKQPPRPFSLSDLRFAFMCLGVGLVLSVFVFILELLYHSLHEN